MLSQICLTLVTVIGFTQNLVIVNEEDMSAVLTVRILSGDLTLGAWAAVEFKTSNKPNSSNTSAAAMCKHYRTLI